MHSERGKKPHPQHNLPGTFVEVWIMQRSFYLLALVIWMCSLSLKAIGPTEDPFRKGVGKKITQCGLFPVFWGFQRRFGLLSDRGQACVNEPSTRSAE